MSEKIVEEVRKFVEEECLRRGKTDYEKNYYKYHFIPVVKYAKMLAKKLKADFAHFAITTPFPATDLYSMGLKQNILPNDYWKEFAKNPKSNFMPYFWEENLNKKELIQLLKNAYHSFYLRPGYIFKKIFQLRSWSEFKDRAKIALNILKI